MKIVAISDTHGFLPPLEAIPECDLLLHAGDVCPDFHQTRYGSRAETFDRGEQRQKRWLDTELRPWLEDVLENRAKRVVAIAGNHDFVFEHPFLIPDLPWTYLRDETAIVDGLRIYGTPWVPKLNRWAFYASDEALEARADSIPPCDILLSHGPPFGLTDKVVPKFGGAHVGDVALLSAIQATRPKAVVCGHIHEGYGVEYMEHSDRSQTAIYNVSYVDENYSDNFRAPIVIDVQGWTP